MCNLYSIIRTQEAMRRLFQVKRCRQLGFILEGNVAAAFLGLPFKSETTPSVRC
jgi:hypothetical protein